MTEQRLKEIETWDLQRRFAAGHEASETISELIAEVRRLRFKAEEHAGFQSRMGSRNKKLEDQNQSLRELLAGIKELANQPVRDRWCNLTPQLLTLLELISLRIDAAFVEKS